MTWEQIYSARRGGEPEKGIQVTTLEEVEEINRNWREYLGV